QAGRRQILHDQTRLTVVVRDDIEHADRVRMMEPCGEPRLPHGALPRVLRLRFVERGVEQELFDGDVTVQQLVLGVPDSTHGTSPDPLDDAIAIGDQATLVAHVVLLGAVFPVLVWGRVPCARGRGWLIVVRGTSWPA